jgi:hypothetical protein
LDFYVLNCVDYDEAFQRDIASKLPAWNEAQKGKKKKRGEKELEGSNPGTSSASRVKKVRKRNRADRAGADSGSKP